MRDLAFLVLGVVLTLTLQLFTGRQTRQREREARLFDVRRQVYAEAMRDVNKHVDDLTTVIKHEDDPGGWGDAQAGIERLEVNLRASLGLVGTPRVRGRSMS